MSATTNAVLTKITGPGEPDRSGDTGEGTTLWEGRAPGYLQRNNRTRLSGGRQLLDQGDVFTILNAAGAPIAEIAGPDWESTEVTIIDRRQPRSPATLKFRVTAMENRAAGTRVDSVRLELEAV